MDIVSAVKYGDKELVTDLLDGGSDVNFQDEYGDTGLITASYAGKLDIVELLLDRGADIDIKGDGGFTARDAEQPDIAKLLKNHGSSKTIQRSFRKYKKTKKNKISARQRLSLATHSPMAHDINEMISGHIPSYPQTDDVERRMWKEDRTSDTKRKASKKKKKKKATKKEKKKEKKKKKKKKKATKKEKKTN